MKSWYMTSSDNILVDDETEIAESVKDCYTNIYRTYIAPCDCKLYFTDGLTDGPIQRDIKKGQIIVTFYKSDLPYSFAILENNNLLSNLQYTIDELQKEKERWAKGKEEKLNKIKNEECKEDCC